MSIRLLVRRFHSRSLLPCRSHARSILTRRQCSSLTPSSKSSEEDENEYDLCIVGAGAAGFSAAVRAWDYGKRVAVLTPSLDDIGGAWVKHGALSSKVMWQFSRGHRHMSDRIRKCAAQTDPSATLGSNDDDDSSTDEDDHDFIEDEMSSSSTIISGLPGLQSSEQVLSRFKRQVSNSCRIKQRHIVKQLTELSEMKGSQTRYSVKEDGGGGSIDLIEGMGRIRLFNEHCKPHSSLENGRNIVKEVRVYDPNHCSKLRRIIRARNYLISTGSVPRIPEQFPEADGIHICTSNHLPQAFEHDFPESVLIFGAGVIGCEYATILSNLFHNDFNRELLSQCDPPLSSSSSAPSSDNDGKKRRRILLFNSNRDRLLPHEDADLSRYIEWNLGLNGGVEIINQSVMREMKIVEGKGVLCRFTQKSFDCSLGKIIETEHEVFVNKVILAVGRVPNLFNLFEVGKDGDGADGGGDSARILNQCPIPIQDSVDDNRLQIVHNHHSVDGKSGSLSSSPMWTNLFICGDALGKMGLVSVAEMEARHCIELMFGRRSPSTKLDYGQINSVMFLRPEVSCVGMNELECRRRGLSFKVGTLSLALMNRSIIDWNSRHSMEGFTNVYGDVNGDFMNPQSSFMDPRKVGFVKMIVSDDDDKILLGVRAIGVDSSSIISSCALCISQGLSIRSLDMCPLPHPSMAESIQECARMLLGRGVYKPHIWPRSSVRHYSPANDTELKAEDILPVAYGHSIPGYMQQ